MRSLSSLVEGGREPLPLTLMVLHNVGYTNSMESHPFGPLHRVVRSPTGLGVRERVRTVA